MNKYENLETERLILVPVNESFIKPCFSTFTVEVTEYMYPKPAENVEETKAFIDQSVELRENDTDYIYAITLKENREFLGFCGLHKLQDEVPELGIWTKMSAHGNHFGREAIGRIIAIAEELGIKRIVYPADRRNIPSKKIALYYGGKYSKTHQETSASGKLLYIEDYIITL